MRNLFIKTCGNPDVAKKTPNDAPLISTPLAPEAVDGLVETVDPPDAALKMPPTLHKYQASASWRPLPRLATINLSRCSDLAPNFARRLVFSHPLEASLP